MNTPPDAGLVAVARVRDLRERDTRIGLQQAVAEHRAIAEQVTVLQAHRDRMTTPDEGTAATFVQHHALAAAASQAVGEAHTRADAAAGLAASARAHWQLARTRLAAVELLLERRAGEREAERRRLEARDLDEVVSQQWLRRRPGGAA